MSNTIAFIFGLSLFLLFWSATGHGLWSIAAWLIRTLFGKDCVACKRKYLGESCNCRESVLTALSNLQQDSRPELPSVAKDLEAASRLLELSKLHQWLSNEQIVNLQQLILSIKVSAREGLPRDTPSRREIPSFAKISAKEEEPVIVASIVESAPEQPKTLVHALDREYEATEVRPTQAPVRQRLTAGLLKSFMEQSNIRWVELISAALIVICSVGLVISLWSTLSSTSRFFPSLVFLLATVAVHGAGQYTLRQWNLRTTSRGILHIGLMLIPLAILVGILLSRRPGGGPTLDTFTILIVGIGIVVYGGLAITASHSLFARRWLIPSTVTIIAGLTLLPIDFLGERQWLQKGQAVWMLLPLLSASMWSAFTMSRSAMTSHTGVQSGRHRRVAGIVVQSLFAIAVPCVFWFVQSRSSGGVGQWWWAATGIFAATWAAWGWSAALSGVSKINSLTAIPSESPSLSNSWFRLSAWIVASLCSVFLIAAIWQTGAHRFTISALLFVAAIWWLFHGWRYQLRIGLVAGGIAFLAATTFVLEIAFGESELIQATDWIGLVRIGTMTTISAIAVLATTIAQRISLQNMQPPAIGFFNSSRRASNTLVLQQLQLAGAVTIGAAAILTLVASLSPIGKTPYGGNWAALLLIAYGVLSIGAGIVACQWSGASMLRRCFVPLGQVILLLGMVRLCQTSPLLEQLLSDLRPTRSWAVGTALLAVGWSVLAAFVKLLGGRGESQTPTNEASGSIPSQQSNIDWLCGVAVVLSVLSAVAIWSNSDQLRWASFIGWFLPVSCAAIFVSWRRSEWREIALITLSLWTCSVVFTNGHAYGWWREMGLACTVALLSVVVTITLIAFEIALGSIQFRLQRDWLQAGSAWAPATLLACCWLGLLASLLGPAIPNIAVSLGANVELAISSFVVQRLEQFGVGLVLLCGIVLAVAASWIGTKHQHWFMSETIALLPVAVALAIAAWFVPPYSLAASLWAIAALLVGSDLLQFAGQSWQGRSIQAWQQLLGQNSSVEREFKWLFLARGMLVTLLIIGTFASLACCISGMLPVNLFAINGEWSSNSMVLLISLGPAVVFGFVRWLFSVGNGEQPRVTAASGTLAATAGASVAALALFGGPTWPSTVIVLLQSFALIVAGFAMVNIGFTSMRNFIGLKRALGTTIGARELISKSLRGARWQRCEKSSWSLVLLAMFTVAALCLGAAFVVIAYPIVKLSGVDRLGGTMIGLTAIVTLLLFWFLFTRRGASHFGLLATALGLISPVGATAYANWLIAVPTRSDPVARDFEPFRMLIALWLVSLSIGLVVRLIAARNRKTFSKLGEVTWIILASLVGALALVSSIKDPNASWPFAELTCLALIVVLSSVVSQQNWRGHLAAIAAAAGMSTWFFHHTGKDEIQLLWNILWGPTWVALVAIAVKLFVERTFDSQREAEQASRLHWSVDRSVSLQVPLASAVLSLLWIVTRFSFGAVPSALYLSVLSLSLAGLVLASARLWQIHSGQRGLAFYFNLVSFALVFSSIISIQAGLPLMHVWLIWMASGLGAMALVAGLLRELVREASMLGATLKFGSITEPTKLQHALHWMPAVHTSASLLALVPSVLLVLSFEERTMRVAATILPFIGALTILPIAFERRMRGLRYVGLSLISSSLVLLWWADLPSAWSVAGVEGAWMFFHRAFVAFVLLGIIYPVLAQVVRNKERWERPLMHVGWAALAIGVTIGVVMLGGEAAEVWNTVAAQADLGTKWMTLLAWSAVVGRLLQFAASPHSTDRLASETTRKTAVYLAEVSLAFLCGGCYFHFPELFSGIFVKWWPLVVFAIAMISAGIGEWLLRTNQRIIADPVGRSSLLLPIIPLSGVWFFHPVGAEWLWSDWGRYSFLLLSASLIYGIQSWIRDSVGLRALASALLLFSFWAFLQSNPNLQFTEHPQFWILPPSLAALLFVESNRKRLAASVVVATRYLAVMMAYLSSTAEVFLKAFEGQLWQPILLLALALAGVAAGIVMRVRAFLYCGLAFTMIALLGMVWHAQQAIGQVWPWWAFGIATGVGLIVLLGYFEKNRPKVVAYLEQFKRWEQ